MADMTLKIVESNEIAAPSKEPQLVLELITPDVVDFLWTQMKPLVDELSEMSGGEFTTDYTYSKVKWGSTNLFYGYVVDDKDEYMKPDINISPVENKYRRIFNNKVKKEFAGYILLEFNPNDHIPPHVWQVVITPKFRNTNILELGQKYIEEEFVKIGAKEITMAALRHGWGKKVESMGFKETFTLYRKKI